MADWEECAIFVNIIIKKGDRDMRASVSLNGILAFINSLSLSAGNKQWLGEKLLEEAKREQAETTDRTDEMLDKHFGVWSDDRSAEEIISELKANRLSRK